MKRLGWLMLVPLAFAACSGDGFALNERVFDAKTMQLRGSSCMRYDLRGSSDTTSLGGGITPSLVLMQRDAGDHVLVSVSEDGVPIVEREYAEAFFVERQHDEFSATSRSGTDSLLLRYWGAPARDGDTGCSPTTDSGPPNK